jgi:HK97 gp10 family phage protein
MANEVTVEGLADLQKLLNQLPARIEANIMRGGLRAASNIYRDRARSNVPRKTGALRKSIKVSTRLKKGVVTATISAGSAEAFYAHMLEFGTGGFFEGSSVDAVGGPYQIPGKTKGGKTRRKKKALSFGDLAFNNVTHPGIRPVAYMRNAFDQGTKEVMDSLKVYITARLAKEAAK